MTEVTDVSKIVLDRLEDQIGWYDKKSQTAQLWYKRLKVISLVSAALIPFLSALKLGAVGPFDMTITAGVLGIVITICEGIQQLNQYHQNWFTYRATCESLKHEKFAYLSHIGEYATAANPIAVLADRVESLISTEHSKWVASQQTQGKDQQVAAGATKRP